MSELRNKDVENAEEIKKKIQEETEKIMAEKR